MEIADSLPILRDYTRRNRGSYGGYRNLSTDEDAEVSCGSWLFFFNCFQLLNEIARLTSHPFSLFHLQFSGSSRLRRGRSRRLRITLNGSASSFSSFNPSRSASYKNPYFCVTVHYHSIPTSMQNAFQSLRGIFEVRIGPRPARKSAPRLSTSSLSIPSPSLVGKGVFEASNHHEARHMARAKEDVTRSEKRMVKRLENLPLIWS